MSFEADLCAFIQADATTAALIGVRLYPDLMPENGAFPAVVYKQIHNTSEQSHDGSSALDHGLVQFDAYARTRAEALAIKAALYTLMIPYRGVMGDTADVCFLHVNDSAGYEADTRLFRATLEIEAWHNL